MNPKTLFFSTIIILGSTTLPAIAGGTWVNKKCQKVAAPSSPDGYKFEIDYKFAFTAERKTQWMYAARASDGSYLFCTSRPNYQAARPMNHSELNFPFVDGITQSKPNSPVFSIIIREGNGRNPKIVPTRLDMSNLQDPIVTPE